MIWTLLRDERDAVYGSAKKPIAIYIHQNRCNGMGAASPPRSVNIMKRRSSCGIAVAAADASSLTILIMSTPERLNRETETECSYGVLHW